MSRPKLQVTTASFSYKERNWRVVVDHTNGDMELTGGALRYQWRFVEPPYPSASAALGARQVDYVMKKEVKNDG